MLAVELNSFWVWWIQIPVVELLALVTPAALSIQFASRGSMVSCCLEADRVGQLQVLSVVEKVLVSSQRKDITDLTFMWASSCAQKTNRQKFSLCIFSSCLGVVREQFREGTTFLYHVPHTKALPHDFSNG